MEQQTTRAVNDVPNTKDMVRRLEETCGVASGMLENLHTQGEQMDRVIDMNNTHSDQLYTAEKLTRQLSFRGRISNMFRKKSGPSKVKPTPQMSTEYPGNKVQQQEKPQKEKKEVEKEEKVEVLSAEDAIWAERSKPPVFVQESKKVDYDDGLPPDLTTAQREMIQEEDNDLDQMANILTSLREMSYVTQAELQNQSNKLDVMDSQVDRNLYSTQKTTNKLAAKYGRAK